MSRHTSVHHAHEVAVDREIGCRRLCERFPGWSLRFEVDHDEVAHRGWLVIGALQKDPGVSPGLLVLIDLWSGPSLEPDGPPPETAGREAREGPATSQSAERGSGTLQALRRRAGMIPLARPEIPFGSIERNDSYSIHASDPSLDGVGPNVHQQPDEGDRGCIAPILRTRPRRGTHRSSWRSTTRRRSVDGPRKRSSQHCRCS